MPVSNRVSQISRNWLAAISWLCLTATAFASERYVFEHEFVLGTSLQIHIEAETPTAAAAAEERLLSEIQRLEKIFSSYDHESELSRWQSADRKPVPVSGELLQVLAASDRWRELSQGAFQPAVAIATRLWQQAEQSGQAPSAESLAEAVQRMQQPHWKLDENSGTAVRLTQEPLSLDAIAKGTILDRAAALALAEDPEIHGVAVNLGGDLCIRGELVCPVQITDPANDALNAPALCQLFLSNQGIATSGGYRRGFEVSGRSYSHLIDPRSAQPVNRYASVTVVAETAETADALATTFSMLSPEECQLLSGPLSGVHYLLVTPAGQQIRSPGWDELCQPRLHRYPSAAAASDRLGQSAYVTADTGSENEAGLLELVVNFELGKPTGTRYRRPYLAIWLEDEDGFPVRTGVLWMMTKQPGPRWHRDLLRWYRNDRTRKLTDDQDLIGVVSEATRGPGKYRAVFDGKDDHGALLKPGKYTLYIEAVREHGTYQLISHPLQLGAEPIAEVKLKSNAEIQSATVEYRQPSGASSRAASE